jgi:hypothetical protein
MLTEDQAKEKWCPFVRVEVGHGLAAANRHTDNGSALVRAQCIASQCMAWRWSGRSPILLHEAGPPDGREAWESYDRLIAQGWTRGSDTPGGVWLNPPKKPEGYCGLAGKGA